MREAKEKLNPIKDWEKEKLVKQKENRNYIQLSSHQIIVCHTKLSYVTPNYRMSHQSTLHFIYKIIKTGKTDLVSSEFASL